jgi:3-dehydroquinate dehydratase-2
LGRVSRLPLSGSLAYNNPARRTVPMPGRYIMPKTVYVLNGPNLDLLGLREPHIYGRATLGDVEKLCQTAAQQHGLGVVFHQSNHEGEIIEWIHEARAEKAAGLIINPAGFTTTSIAILDALLALAVPIIEVHISNIHAREEFRRNSYVSTVARAVICGCGTYGYALAIAGLANIIDAKE